MEEQRPSKSSDVGSNPICNDTNLYSKIISNKYD
jgi:hypothetical protein